MFIAANLVVLGSELDGVLQVAFIFAIVEFPIQVQTDRTIVTIHTNVEFIFSRTDT